MKKKKKLVEKTEIPIMLQLAQASKMLVKRIFDILESKAMTTSKMYCNPLTQSDGKRIATTFVSPLIEMKDKLRVNDDIRVMAQAAQVFGQPAYDVISRDEVIKEYYIKNGFNPKYILDEDEIKKTRAQERANDIELAQAGVRPQRATPGNISL